jgi:hypothetical protein
MLCELIGRESIDERLRQKHFLMVAAYNLQHPAQFTVAAIQGLQTAFAEYLDGAISIAEIRRRTARAYDGPTPVRKQEGQRTVVRRDWSMTIANVYVPNDLERAAERVQSWAEEVRHEISGRH